VRILGIPNSCESKISIISSSLIARRHNKKIECTMATTFRKAMSRCNLITAVYLASLSVCAHGWSTPVPLPFSGRKQRSQKAASSTTIMYSVAQPFGRQEYWEGFYKDQSNANETSFSWYAGWNDLEPLISEWIAPAQNVLMPGVGIDSLVRDMYDAGYEQLTAFDYAPESIAHCQRMLGKDRTVDLSTADARDLPYASESFDAVIDKGTLDAVFLAGDDMDERLDSLTRALAELDRVLRPGGIFWSLSAICVEPLQSAPLWKDTDCWEAVTTDGSLYTTADGYTSNNVDGTLLVWRKLS
jgi:SAM-dependent methyltransferase